VNARVGVVGPFSGARSAWGDTFRLSFESVVKGARGVEWLLKDDRGDEDAAEALARELVAEDVVAVVGHYASFGALRALPHYRAANITLLAPAASHPDLIEGPGSVFRLCSTDDHQVKLLASLLTESGVPAACSVIHDSTQYGTGLARRLASLLSGIHHQEIRCWPPDRDAARVTRSEQIVFAGAHHHSAQVISGLRKAGFAGRFIASDDSHIDDFPLLAGRAAEGAIIVRPVPSFAETTALAFRILVWSLDRWSGSSRDQLRTLLRHAPRGVSFDERGENQGASWELSEVVAGRLRPLSRSWTR